MRISKPPQRLASILSFLIVALVFGALPASADLSPHSNSFLLNGSFEADWGWENHYDGPDPSGISSSRSYHGTRSLLITDSSTSTSEGWRSKAIDIISGASYTATAQINTDTGQPPHLYLKYYDDGDSEVASFGASGPSGLDMWQEAVVTGRAPTDAVSARVVAYSISTRVTESYFDAIAFGPSTSQSLIGNQDFELDAYQASMPQHWYHYSGTSPVSVEIDPDDGDNQVLEIVDTSVTLGTNAATRFTAAPGAKYEVSLDIRRAASSDAIHAYVKYYDEADNELTSTGQSTDTSTNMWEPFAISTYAPQGSVAGEIVIACISNRQCDSLVDNVESIQVHDETLYVALTASGAADGSSPNDPASYTDSSFWSDVDSSLSTNSVNVVILDNVYSVDSDSDALRLNDLGSSSRRLTISGESPYGAVFSLDGNLGGPVIKLTSVTNVTVSDFHITSSGSYTNNSAFLITAGDDETTQDVELRRFTIFDMPGILYSGVGISAFEIESAVSGVSIQGGTFTRNGTTTGFHHIYIQRMAADVDISGNLFEDSAGTYVKLRDALDGVDVTANLFFATGDWYNNVQFVQLAVYNDVNPGDEWFGGGYRFVDNRFVHIDSWCDPNCRVFSITHQGYNPVDDNTVERDHLLDSSKRNELLDTSPGNIGDRTDVVEDNFFIQLNDCDGICISGTTWYGYDVPFILWTTHAYGAASQGGSGTYDISNLFDY